MKKKKNDEFSMQTYEENFYNESDLFILISRQAEFDKILRHF